MDIRPMEEAIAEAGHQGRDAHPFHGHQKLAGAMVGANRHTARSWATGRRRAPLAALEQLRRFLIGRIANANDQLCDLSIAIERRRGMPSRRGLGFRAVDPLTGRDKRWRLGRMRRRRP
jgi:hypothetical protein